MRIIKVFKETISDGPGFRYAIYFSGCKHRCEGCHNPESWNPDIGEKVDGDRVEEITSDINSNPLLSGITLSGGDPFYNPTELLVFLKKLTENTDLDIWIYTGYTFEELVEDKIKLECLKYIDTLVDGKFEADKFNPALYYRGSSNQRIVDVKKSLNKSEVTTKDYK